MPQSLSISFTLGKASQPHEANIPHANREFIAKNIDQSKTHQNITYVRQDVEDAYRKLFGAAVEEYNKKQYRADRKIENYYKHVSEGKREEAFYEAIVQFGDSKTAPCGSENGKLTQQMLDEYIHSFRKRNPNLHVFNAVMHLDEASPHLHINFIPFYTKPRKNGLSVGVSMKAALDEMGFDGKNYKQNRLVAWEESERACMEKILNEHGYTRDDKNAKYAHLTVEDYKIEQDRNQLMQAIRQKQNISPEELKKRNVQMLKTKITQLEQQTEQLTAEKFSPYKSFFYESPEKQSYMMAKLKELQIPFRETENGFEAQQCYVNQIRKAERLYVSPKKSYRETLRDDVDRLLMQSKSFDELLEKLKRSGYLVKTGKYIAVKPDGAENFIRLKSLGEFYSEYALKNRIKAKEKFERDLDAKLKAETERGSSRTVVLKTMRFYIVTYTGGALPMRKRDLKKPYAWTNDAELDKLLALNKRLNEGTTLETLRREFAAQEEKVSGMDAALQKQRSDLKSFHELKEKIEIVFEGKKSAVFTYDQAKAAVQQFPNIGQNNYKNIYDLIETETANLKKAEESMAAESEKLKEASEILSTAEKVMGGTYVQTLVGEERQRREAKYVPNGLKNAE